MCVEEGDAPITVGYSFVNLETSVSKYENPTTVDESQTGFRRGYYGGLFEKLPVKKLVINRDIAQEKYYSVVRGASTSRYSTVYDQYVYYSPFYNLDKLDSVVIGEKVTQICNNTFEATINGEATIMENSVFGSCYNITSVVSLNKVAPIGGTFTNRVYQNAILTVPAEAVESYKNDDYWKKFYKIETGIRNIIADSSSHVKEVLRYTVNGRRVNKSHKGMTIIKYSDGSTKKVMVK